VERGAPANDLEIYRQNPTGKRWDYTSIQPFSQDRSLCWIAPLHQQNADLQLKDRNGGDVESCLPDAAPQ
jgi:hypothetical protein